MVTNKCVLKGNDEDLKEVLKEVEIAAKIGRAHV